MAKRRSKYDLGIDSAQAGSPQEINIAEMRGIVAPISGESVTVTLRLAGVWHSIWQNLRRALPGHSDSEILRQAVALRTALTAVGSDGKQVVAIIKYKDKDGKTVSVDLLEHVGIQKGAPPIKV